MAREESDREDILAEATALVERVELAIEGESEHIVVGFRSDGSLSVFFGADPVYQFNAVGQLRRAHVAGILYKADRGRLASLTRKRTTHEVQLLRHDLNAAETASLIARMEQRLNDLRGALVAGQFQLSGQVPRDSNVVNRVQRWLVEHPGPFALANSPRVGR